MNTKTFPSVPRKASLHHRLKTAKDSDGKPLLLLDELMILLEDPPPEVVDRWQAGVELCVGHGIETSRAAVWRFYRAFVLRWRYENAPDFGPVTEPENARRAEEARHLLTLRAMESLHEPHLPPHVLVGLVHHENRRQELQLARDKFDEQLFLRQREDDRIKFAAMKKAAEKRAFQAAWAKTMQGTGVEPMMEAIAAKKAAQARPPQPAAAEGNA